MMRCLQDATHFLRIMYGNDWAVPLYKHRTKADGRTYEQMVHESSTLHRAAHLVSTKRLPADQLDLDVITCLNGTPDAAPTKVFALAERATHVLGARGIPYFLHAGTLLHLYRNCTLLKDTTDLDIGVPLNYLARAVTALKMAGLDVARTFGENVTSAGAEFQYVVGGVGRLDVLSLNDANGDRPWTPLWVGGVLRKCYMAPFRGTKLLAVGTVFFRVPENPDEQLAALYGPGWRTPISSDTWKRQNAVCQ
jgi:hypothetical protein